jgi:hypothetical protein
MSKVHILDSTGGDTFRAVAHLATPTGSNSVSVPCNAVSVPWKTCYLAAFGSGAPTSALLVGNGAGKISQSEMNSISSGDLIEIPFLYGDDPSLDATGRTALIDLLAQRAIDEFKANFAVRFKYYGYTQG